MQRWDEGISYVERETIDVFLKLPAPQRKLIRKVILTFAKMHGEATTQAREQILILYYRIFNSE